jgi:hypothetical protein
MACCCCCCVGLLMLLPLPRAYTMGRFCPGSHASCLLALQKREKPDLMVI